MEQINHLPDRTLKRDGKEWLYFSGTSYLGITHDKRFQAQILEGMQKYGSNFGGSRLGIPQLEIFEKAEKVLAQLGGAEKALTFSSGTLAGQILIRHLQTAHDFLYAPGAHPATWGQIQAPRMPYQDWVEQILEKAFKERRPFTFIVNSVDPLHARRYSLDWIHQLPTDIPYTLIVDDSHSLGVLGKKGGGTLSNMEPPPNLKLIVVSSLAKAFGIPGGVLMGSKALIESIYSGPFFGGASPIIPAYLYAFLNTQEYYQENRQRLINNSRLFQSLIQAANALQYFPDYPVFYTPYHKLADFLKKHEILISSFSYPTPKDEPITRIVLSSWHTKNDISLLANLVKEFFADYRIADDR